MKINIKDNISLIFNKFKEDKKSLMIILIGVIGMLLVSFSAISETETYEPDKEDIVYGYESSQRDELEKIISEISGVGRVRVMITYECSRECVFAVDTSEQTEDNSTKIFSEHIIVDNGNDEDGLLLKEIFPKVLGVAVVCEGGGNPTVKNEISMMIKAVYGISSNNISISEMKN